MKSFKKIFALFLISASLLLCLSSCIEGDTAKTTMQDFLNAVQSHDYAKAKTYLHPERPADLKEFFDNVEAKKKIDFQSGIAIERYSNVRSAHYDSSVGGSIYSSTMQVKIGDRSAEIWIEIVDNDAGYGIYNLDINIED